MASSRMAATTSIRGSGCAPSAARRTGFAYSDELSLLALQQSVTAARGIAAAGAHGKVKAWARTEANLLYPAMDPLQTLDKHQKIALLEQMDKFARSLDPAINQVMASISGVYEEVLVAATDGTLAADVRPLVRLSVTVIAEKGDRRERGSAGGGGRFGYDWFLELDGLESRAFGYVREAVRQALVNLEAIDAPAGTMPVVLGSGWPGVLLHEAVGHGLEGDFNRKGSSAFAGRIGEQVASKHCTIVDDGTLPGRRGSVSIDDEGTPGGYNVLIENGILKGYLQDKQNARLMGVPLTGNGRRESYAAMPMPRMTNTYMLAGQYDPARDHRLGEEGHLCPQLRWRSGGHHLRQVCLLRLRGLPHRGWQDHCPHQGRDPDRQRPRSDEPGLHGGLRSCAGSRGWHLRQGGAERAGRCRPSPPSNWISSPWVALRRFVLAA